MVNRIANPDQQLPQYVKGYIADPRETYSCELKPWIDPETNDHDVVMIAKTCLALRNKGGGTLLIGISNDGELLDLPDGYDPAILFTQDKMQAIVSIYSAQQFGIDVYHVEMEEPQDRRVVAVVIPGDISTPCSCKKDSNGDRPPHVKRGIIYTRTTESNGTISSATASQQDLEDITKRCFGNRVADIGQFLRDHLTEENVRVLKQVVENNSGDSTRNHQQELDDFTASSAAAFTISLDKNGGD